MTGSQIEFKPIEFETQKGRCTTIRLDSFVASFGYDLALSKFIDEADDYLAWLKNTLTIEPARAVHLIENRRIIGQLEIAEFWRSPNTGKLNLIYLLPEFRGKGYAEMLHKYATDYFNSKGYTSAVLRCSPTNLRAYAFYKKMGWVDKGSDPNHQDVRLMEVALNGAR